MRDTQSRRLTAQFYEWETRGRGWHKAAFPADLEPPFEPFFGHAVEQEIIDDGKRETWLRRLFAPSKPIEPVPQEEALGAYPYADTSPLSVYSVILPRQFRPSAERMEQLLVMLSYRRSPVSFEIVGAAKTVTLQLACREPDSAFLRAQLDAFFPDCVVLEAEEDYLVSALETGLPLYTVDFGLREEFMRPIATIANGDTDPYAALFGIISRLKWDERVILQTLFSGTQNPWAESTVTAVTDNGGKASFFLDAPDMPQLAREKVARPLLGVAVRAVTLADTLRDAGLLLQEVSTAVIHSSKSVYNALVPLTDYQHTIEDRLSDIALRQSHRVGMLLNSRELATLAHLPPVSLSRRLLGQHRATKAAPPFLVGEPYRLGINSHQGIDQEVGIGAAQRSRHVHIIGSTGTGKSTLLHSLIMQDILSGDGLCVIDPHGDLVESVLNNIPEGRIGDVVLIDPTDSAYPVGLNILHAHSDLERELLASDLVALFRRFSTSWGDQMNSVFANAISAFVYNTKIGTLGDLRKFLIEQPFRNAILATCTDPDIAYYWQKEYPILKSSSIGSILTRLDSFLRPKIIRNMVCQRQSLNFQKLMDGKKIVLVKLSQGLLGEENSYLLGAFIVSKLQQTAMARQVQELHHRVPFYCYIDEFQHFVTPSMNTILSGARKYSLGLVLAHQDMQQVSKTDNDIAASVLSNAGTRICFRLGDTDARRMQEGVSGFTAEDLQNLATGEAVARVSTKDQDFNISVVAFDSGGAASSREEIIGRSRAAYSVPVATAAPSETVKHEPQQPATQPEPKLAEPSHVPPPTPDPAADAPQQSEIREHRYLQTLIKKMAEEYGYKASLEATTPDGKGQVDVLLERGGQRMAVEVSVTTSAEWELHNVRKCLGAGYERIVVCTNSPSKRQQIQRLIETELLAQEQAVITVTMPEDIPTLFDTAPGERTATIKGYRVTVNYEPGANREHILQNLFGDVRKR